MADTKITGLTEDTAPASTDVTITVDDTGGSPVTKKVQWANIGTQLKAATTSATGVVELATNAETTTGTATDRAVTPAGLKSAFGTYRLCGTIGSPGDVYDVDTQIPLFRAPAALTITRIHISGPDATPSTELDIDLKWASDTTAWTDAAVIDVCDTTSGVVTITTGFDDATIASGKYIYWEFGADPHADWTFMYYEIYFTYD